MTPKPAISEPESHLGTILTPDTGKSGSTVARTLSEQSCHWYTKDGQPAYEMAKKDGSGMRPVTLADARKLNLLPSVTTYLKVIDKPALNTWREEQACLSVLTAPRFEAESLDEFVYRVLHTEKQQDQEAQGARDRGTFEHDNLQRLFKGKPIIIGSGVVPVYQAISKRAKNIALGIRTEEILVGDGYAGKCDLIQEELDECLWIWDWKTTKNPPKYSWPEHRLQLAAYAAALESREHFGFKTIRTGNVYISTEKAGDFIVCENPPWEPDYKAFKHLVAFWQWQTGYIP